MRKFLKIPQLLAIVLLASMALAGTSCKKKKDDPPTPGTPPTLPPIESLEMDFSDFDTPPPADGTKIVVNNYTYYREAHTDLGFWRSLLEDDLLAIPVAALANARTKTGQEASSGTFEWSLSFSALSASYVGTLKAVKGSTSYTLELNVAPSSSPSSTVKYLDGTVSNDLSTADWNIFEGSVHVLDGLYNKNATSGYTSLDYTYVKTGQAESNSSILYTYTPSASPYNATFDLDMSYGLVEIEWDTSTMAGRVKSPNLTDPATWYAWTTNLADIE